MTIRDANPNSELDLQSIADIYNQGIEDRTSTFETRPRTTADIDTWFDGVHPILVAEEGGNIIGWASTSAYSSRDCYSGICEFSVYVSREARGRGAGKKLMEALIAKCNVVGSPFFKLVSRVHCSNHRSLRMLESVGFRQVGLYKKHAKLDGVWKDVIIVERLVGQALIDEENEAAASSIA